MDSNYPVGIGVGFKMIFFLLLFAIQISGPVDDQRVVGISRAAYQELGQDWDYFGGGNAGTSELRSRNRDRSSLAATVDAISPRSALFRGDLNQDAFFALFHELSKEGQVWISQDQFHKPFMERLGGVQLNGQYYHVYREAA